MRGLSRRALSSSGRWDSSRGCKPLSTEPRPGIDVARRVAEPVRKSPDYVSASLQLKGSPNDVHRRIVRGDTLNASAT
jgi:hypothetical protein